MKTKQQIAHLLVGYTKKIYVPQVKLPIFKVYTILWRQLQ